MRACVGAAVAVGCVAVVIIHVAGLEALAVLVVVVVAVGICRWLFFNCNYGCGCL